MLEALNSIAADFSANFIDYLVYIAEALVTLIGVCKCLLPLMGTTRALRRAIRRLQQDAGTRQGTPVWQEKQFMGVRLKGSWLRFLQNAEQLDRRGLPCNVEDYINDDTVTHGPGNAQLAELIPSLLTSLGILGTFMGMMSGLSGLDFTSSSKIIDGIPILLDGMRFAFGTSVVGVSCSICFNMLNRILQGSSYRAIDDFVECFTSLAMSRPLDNDVQLICQNQDSNHMLSGLSDVLPGTLASVMEGSVSRAMQPVAQAMDSFLIGATRAQVDGVARIVSSFVQQMNMNLSDQFVQLGRTMTEINQNQRASLDHVTQAMQASGVIVSDVRQLHAVTQDVMAHFEQYVQELSAARSRDERFEQSASALLEKMAQMNRQQSAALQQVSDGYQALMNSMNQFSSRSGAAVDGMRGVSEQLSGACQSFIGDAVGSLNGTLGQFEQSMTSLVGVLGEKIDALAAASADDTSVRETGELQRLLTQLTDALAANGPAAKEA